MIRKGIVVICVLLSMGCAWAWYKSCRNITSLNECRAPWAFRRWNDPWMRCQKIITEDVFWLTIQNEKIELTLVVQDGIVTMELGRYQYYIDDEYYNGSSTLTSPAFPVCEYRPPQFDFYHFRDWSQTWCHTDVYDVTFPLWFIMLLLMSYPILAFYMGPVRRRRRRRLGLCIHCGYDLRGTQEPRCSECGEESTQGVRDVSGESDR